MSGSQPSPAPLANQTFDFTKRKQFADLLITELVGTIILVLSSDCKILFCGPAVTDLLGWRDEDLVDGNLIELINEEDQACFRNCFEESLRTRNELVCYVRFKCKSQISTAAMVNTKPKEVLLEFKGHPHYIGDEETCRCFFAAAAPYPGRNTAMLNTFLDLKMQNEHLQQRVADLRQRASSLASASSVPAYGNTMMQPSYNTTQPRETLQPYFGMPMGNAGGNNGMTSDLTSAGTSSSHRPAFAWNPVMEENLSEDSMRKKLKKSHNLNRHVCVTCGRTDSPEWRKGPQGPKTLCNACGLRWAKYQRGTGDNTTGGDTSQGRVRGSSSNNA